MGNMHAVRSHATVASYRLPAASYTSFLGALSRKTYAMVLAGGRGTRLMNLTHWRAKLRCRLPARCASSTSH